MDVSPLGKSRLVLGIKRTNIQSKRESKKTVDNFQKRLSAAVGDNFYLLDFEVGCAFKFDMLHNANAAIGYGGGLVSPVEVSLKDLEEYFHWLVTHSGDDTVLVYSNYRKVIPFVVTKLSSFVDNYELFSDLMENEVSIVSEDLSQYLEFNFYNLQSMENIELIAVGDRYKNASE